MGELWKAELSTRDKMLQQKEILRAINFLIYSET